MLLLHYGDCLSEQRRIRVQILSRPQRQVRPHLCTHNGRLKQTLKEVEARIKQVKTKTVFFFIDPPLPSPSFFISLKSNHYHSDVPLLWFACVLSITSQGGLGHPPLVCDWKETMSMASLDICQQSKGSHTVYQKLVIHYHGLQMT